MVAPGSFGWVFLGLRDQRLSCQTILQTTPKSIVGKVFCFLFMIRPSIFRKQLDYGYCVWYFVKMADSCTNISEIFAFGQEKGGSPIKI